MKYKSLIKPPDSKVMKSGRVMLDPGEEVGEHVTENKEEMIIVIKGTATLLMEGVSTIVQPGETVYIKEGVRHNVKNETDRELEYVYVVSLFT